MLVMAGTQLAPIVSEARTLGQFVAPAHQRLSALAQNLWWSWDNDTTSLFRELDPVLLARVRPQPGRAAAADPDRDARGARVSSSRCTAASTTPTAACRSTCSRSTPGARATPACCGRGRSPTSPPSSACTSRCRSTPAASASSPAITSRARRTSAFRWSASASTTTRATSGSGSIATAGSTRTTSTSTARLLPIQPAMRDGVPVDGRDRDPHRHDRRARLAAGGRPQHAAAARLERRRQPARGSRADRAPLRRRRPRPHPPGAAARRRRRARAARRWASRRASCISTKATARSPRSSSCASGWTAKASTPGEAIRRVVGADRLHHAHAGAGRPRSLLAGRSSKSTSVRCATRSASATTS